MSEVRHTPGTWFTHREGFSTIYVEARIGGGMLQEVAACGPTAAGHEQQEANARLIAAAPDLLEALQWREQFEPREGEDVNERFERIAAVFYRETGHLRPGKDCSMESMDVRQAAWDEWMEAGRAKARAAIAKALGATT